MHKQEQTEKEISLTFSLDRIIWIIHFINVLCVSTVYDRGVCVWLIQRVLCVCVVPDSWLVPASEPAANRLASVSSCGLFSPAVLLFVKCISKWPQLLCRWWFLGAGRRGDSFTCRARVSVLYFDFQTKAQTFYQLLQAIPSIFLLTDP